MIRSLISTLFKNAVGRGGDQPNRHRHTDKNTDGQCGDGTKSINKLLPPPQKKIPIATQLLHLLVLQFWEYGLKPVFYISHNVTMQLIGYLNERRVLAKIDRKS